MPMAQAAPVVDARAQGAALAQSCAAREGWGDAAPPARIFGNVYYVGTCGITVLLITSPRGHILIDAATQDAVPSILANIRTLGFDPHDVKYLLNSHEHIDHAGGFAALKRATGAQLLARQPARATLETGQSAADDPQIGLLSPMPPVGVDRIVADGEVLRLGGNMLTVIPTPGHTAGGTSWSWRACEGRQCATIAYVDSLTAISAEGYHFTDHPERVAPFRATFARVMRLPCQILLTPHPGASGMFERLAGNELLIEPSACRSLAESMSSRLDARLAHEAAAR